MPERSTTKFLRFIDRVTNSNLFCGIVGTTFLAWIFYDLDNSHRRLLIVGLIGAFVFGFAKAALGSLKRFFFG